MAALECTACGVSARGQASGGGGQGRQVVNKRDSKGIIRQWDREIEAEIRREAARQRDKGRWKAVVWGALWFLWLGLLFGAIAFFRLLH